MQTIAIVFALLVGFGFHVVRAESHTNVTYGEMEGEKLLLDIHAPKMPGSFPVAILIHGGGWGSGSKEGDISPLLGSLSEANFVWFSINYRLAPKHHWPACFNDVQTAIRWVKAHASDYKGDPKRIALIGYSAGGHLACLAAVNAGEDTKVQAVVGLAAPTDMPADTARRGGLSESMQALLDRPATVDSATSKLLEKISPIYEVKPGLPPFLLIHGTEDKSVQYVQSQNFLKVLKERRVPCELITVKGAPHRLAEWEKYDLTYRDQMISWLRTTLGSARKSDD